MQEEKPVQEQIEDAEMATDPTAQTPEENAPLKPIAASLYSEPDFKSYVRKKVTFAAAMSEAAFTKRYRPSKYEEHRDNAGNRLNLDGVESPPLGLYRHVGYAFQNDSGNMEWVPEIEFAEMFAELSDDEDETIG